ncbi:MAG: hypothetical protein ACTSPI_17350 [Candidatus Heimdallarchaeaceae archaeon]
MKKTICKCGKESTAWFKGKKYCQDCWHIVKYRSQSNVKESDFWKPFIESKIHKKEAYKFFEMVCRNKKKK